MLHAHTSKSTDSSRYLSEGVSSHYRESRVIAVSQAIPDGQPPTYAALKRTTGNPQANAKRQANATVKPNLKKRPSNTGAPLIVKRYVRWLFGKKAPRRKIAASSRTAFKAPQRAFIATGSIALALLAVVPSRVASHSTNDDACQTVVQSGAEISRGGLSHLVSIPSGAKPTAVRELIDVPYCLLPVPPSAQNDLSAEAPVVTREAYPLAFDPGAWVVVNYAESGYVGYDFVLKR